MTYFVNLFFHLGPIFSYMIVIRMRVKLTAKRKKHVFSSICVYDVRVFCSFPALADHHTFNSAVYVPFILKIE